MTNEEKAKAAFEAQSSGGQGTTKWDELTETVKAAWVTAVSTTLANDPKLVNVHATGTVGSMMGTNPNVNPYASQAPPAPPAAQESSYKDSKNK